MKNIVSRIAAIEKEIKETPCHKGTEHHLGQLRARLAKLKRRLEVSKKTGGSYGFALKKFGDATVVLLGPPSVGKSTLLNQLTGARSRVEPWPFTTLKVIPGMMKYKGAQIQLLDLPGIISGAHQGRGRGQEVFSVARTADLLLLVIDPQNMTKRDLVFKELEKSEVNVPTLLVVNKSDLLKNKKFRQLGRKAVFISAKTGFNLEKLKEIIWQELKLMRVYLKPKGRRPDFAEPLILKKGERVVDAFKKVFPHQKRPGQVLLWGHSARFPGQQVSLSHRLKDGDILTFY